MSPKECSLARNEDGVPGSESQDSDYKPNLKVLVNPRYDQSEDSSSTEDNKIVKVVGKMTISF